MSRLILIALSSGALSGATAGCTTEIPNGDVDLSQREERFFDSVAWSDLKPALDNDESPARHIAALEIHENGGVGRCTCFQLFNQHSCVTNAHCLYNCCVPSPGKPCNTNQDVRGFRTMPTIRFWAGADVFANPISPGTYTALVPKQYAQACHEDPLRRRMSELKKFDVAMIRFRGAYDAWRLDRVAIVHPDSHLDPNVPEASPRTRPSGWLLPEEIRAGQQNLFLTVPGYPGNAEDLIPLGLLYPRLMGASQGGAFVPTHGFFAPFVFYKNATEGGMSGAPVIKSVIQGPMVSRRVIAVHIGPFNVDGVPDHNGGILLRDEVLQWLAMTRGHN